MLTVGQKFAVPSSSLASGTFLLEVADIDGSTVPLTRGRNSEGSVILVVKNPASNIPVVGEDVCNLIGVCGTNKLCRSQVRPSGRYSKMLT